MEEAIITISPSSNDEGYMMSVYDSEKAYEDGVDVDGGLCTGSFLDAIKMASDIAQTYYKNKNTNI